MTTAFGRAFEELDALKVRVAELEAALDMAADDLLTAACELAEFENVLSRTRFHSLNAKLSAEAARAALKGGPK